MAGVCTISSTSFVGANLSVSRNTTIGGNLIVDGTLTIPSITSNVVGNVTGDLTGNVVSTANTSVIFTLGIGKSISNVKGDLDVTGGDALFSTVGIGSEEPDGILDVSGGLSNPAKKYILLPLVSAAGTSVLISQSVLGGALIYNTTLRKLQFYNGDAWETVTSQV